MKKLSLVLLVTLICSLLAFPAGAQDTITVLVDGEPVVFDVAPIFDAENNRVLLPLRAVGESLGAYVGWDAETRSITIGRRGILQRLTLDDPTMVIQSDSEKKETVLDVAPYVVDGRTLVPIRCIAEGFNAQVDWDNETKTVTVTTNHPVFMTINKTDVTEGIYQFLLTQFDVNPEARALFMFAFIQPAEEAGITVSEQEVWEIFGVDSAETYKAAQKEILSYGMSAEEFDLCNKASVYTEKLFNKIAEDVTYDELKAFYESEFITAKHILLTYNENKDQETVKKQAEELLSQINDGADFDELMNRYSEDPGLEDYPTGYTFTKNEMIEVFESAAYALEIGEVSELIETDYGYHIIKRMPLEDMLPVEIEALRETYADQFMLKAIEEAIVTKNQELIDSVNLDLRLAILEMIYYSTQQ